jgi:hypothetical protein
MEALNDQESFEDARSDELLVSADTLNHVRYDLLRFRPKEDPEPRVQAIIGIIDGSTFGFE